MEDNFIWTDELVVESIKYWFDKHSNSGYQESLDFFKKYKSRPINVAVTAVGDSNKEICVFTDKPYDLNKLSLLKQSIENCLNGKEEEVSKYKNESLQMFISWLGMVNNSPAILTSSEIELKLMNQVIEKARTFLTK